MSSSAVAAAAAAAAPADLRGRDLLGIADLSPAELAGLLESAAALKAEWVERHAHRDQPLAGRAVALLFQKPSLRTRVSFELAAQQLGGRSIYLSDADVGLGRRESADDIARTLDRWVDALVARTFAQATLDELAAAMTVPVINALSDREHPCQALADLLTLKERFGRLEGLTLAFVGEGNNVFHSLALACAALGVHLRLACPPGYGPDLAIMAEARLTGQASGAHVLMTHDPRTAVAGADAVYTDTWVSMGSEDQAVARRRAFANYRVDAGLMALASPDAVFLHCLPAHRGEEVTDDVIDGPRSLAFDQAENRLHAQKALLAAALRPGA
ncbi:MAG: ornithine carbamoyltransferase [Candidatus Limnocylindrales bacterium]